MKALRILNEFEVTSFYAAGSDQWIKRMREVLEEEPQK